MIKASERKWEELYLRENNRNVGKLSEGKQIINGCGKERKKQNKSGK